MKQKKKTSGQMKEPTRRYINPYESTTDQTHLNRVRSSSSRYTYKGMSDINPSKRTDLKVISNTGEQIKRQKKKANSTKSKKNLKNDKNKSQIVRRTPSASQKTQVGKIGQMTPEQRRMQMRKKKPTLTKKQRERLRKKRQRQFVFRVGLTMCFMIVAIFGGIKILGSFNKTAISYQVVNEGYLDNSTSFNGIVLRSEKVVLSEEEGLVTYVAAEGGKVEKGGTVYALVDEENLATTTAVKEEIDSKIYNEAKKNEAISNNQDKRYYLDEDVKNTMSDFYNKRYESSTANIFALRSQLDSIVKDRTNLYTTEQEEKNSALADLKKEVESNLELYHKGKATTVPGIITYSMDGFETEDALAAVNALTYEAYSEYKKGAPFTALAPSSLKKEEPIYRLVTNNEWYVVTYIDTEEDTWTLNEEYDLNFEILDNKSIAFTLIAKSEEANRTKLVFKTDDQIDKVLGLREVNFSIGDKAVSGLKIPLEAIVDLNLIKVPAEYVTTVDDVKGVYRKGTEGIEFVAIKAHETTEDEYRIIQDLTNPKTLQLNDVLVISEEGKTYALNEIEVTQGVYTINSQKALFKSIEILTRNDEYAIVQYDAKSQLKKMDKIIANPKSVSKDQLLEDMKIQNE